MTLKTLFDDYKEFEEIKKNKTNLENADFNPATALPLLCECQNENPQTEYGINACKGLKNKLDNDMLFSKLPDSRMDSDELNFLGNYVENLDSSYGSYFLLRHTISELINNVFDHSGDNIHSYVFSKFHVNNKKLDIGVADNGLTIPGVFEKFHVNFENDCHAIGKAIGTFSTVSDKLYERGNGLRTVVRLVAEGNGGEILIVSRNGLLHINGEDYAYYQLDEEHKFRGTLVSIRLNKYEVQNIYELLELNNLESYRYTGAIHDYKT